jgi:flagellar protein FliS
MTYPNYSHDMSAAYKQNSVSTASQTELIVMLYDGALRFLQAAVDAVEKNDIQAKAQSSDRALAIVQHLHLSLEIDEANHIAVDLERLYSFVISKIVDGSAQLSTKSFKEAIKVLDTLRSAWSELAQKETSESVPTELLADQAANGKLAIHG